MKPAATYLRRRAESITSGQPMKVVQQFIQRFLSSSSLSIVKKSILAWIRYPWATIDLMSLRSFLWWLSRGETIRTSRSSKSACRLQPPPPSTIRDVRRQRKLPRWKTSRQRLNRWKEMRSAESEEPPQGDKPWRDRRRSRPVSLSTKLRESRQRKRSPTHSTCTMLS